MVVISVFKRNRDGSEIAVGACKVDFTDETNHTAQWHDIRTVSVGPYAGSTPSLRMRLQAPKPAAAPVATATAVPQSSAGASSSTVAQDASATQRRAGGTAAHGGSQQRPATTAQAAPAIGRVLGRISERSSAEADTDEEEEEEEEDDDESEEDDGDDNEDAVLVGEWRYGTDANPKSYFIEDSRDGRRIFRQGQYSGVLKPSDQQYTWTADLRGSKGEVAGTIRLRLGEGGDYLTSNFRKDPNNKWSQDIIANKIDEEESGSGSESASGSEPPSTPPPSTVRAVAKAAALKAAAPKAAAKTPMLRRQAPLNVGARR